MTRILKVVTILFVTFIISSYLSFAQADTIKLIGVNNDFPFSFFDVDGRPTGYAIEFLEAYANEHGHTLQVELYSTEQALDVFESEGDIFYDGSYFKKISADKSLPLFVQEFYLYTTKERAQKIDPDDLHSFYEASTNFSNHLIGIRNSQVVDDYVQSLAPKENLIEYPTISDVFEAINKGYVDIALLPFHQSNSVLNHFSTANIEYIDQKLYFKNTGFWVKEEATLHELDDYILAQKKSGFITELNNKWLTDFSLKNKEDFYLKIFNIALGFSIVVILYLIYRGNTLQKKITSRTRQLREKLDENKQLYDEVIRHEKFKNDYFINLSHELRTPLNVILGAIQLNELYLAKENYDKLLENAEDFTKIIKSNSFRLLRVVNNLIDITRMDADKYTLNIDLVDLVFMSEDLIQSIQPYADKKNIQLVFKSTADEAIVECDPFEIERVIMNLLSNAIKFSRTNSKIHISVFYSDDKSALNLSVADQGIGISQDDQLRIFDRFAQVDTTLNRRHEGHGIGLSLVKNIIDLHGGDIDVQSQLGQGATFTFTIPVKTVYTGIDIDGIKSAREQHDRNQAITLEFSELQQDSGDEDSFTS